MKPKHRAMLLPWAGGGSGPSSLLTSLISYWTLEEASGTRVDSVVASGNDLTDNNTATQNPGKVGNAAQFTSANSESLTRNDNASLSTGDIDFTVAAWVYLDSKAARQTIATKGGGGAPGSDEWVLDYLNSSDRFRFFTGGASYKIATANNLGSPSTATWYFIVAWHDAAADTVNIQVNDGTVNSTATTGVAPSDTTQQFKIGQYGASFYMDGRVDEIGFWKRVLTAAERTALYNSGNGRTYPFTGT